MSENRTWIIFTYRIPTEPSTVRVRVWRILKSIGALYIQQSVCVLPHTEETKKKINSLRTLIIENHGEATVLEVLQFSNQTEDQIIALFNEQRETEYKEFLEGCESFQDEIKRETVLGKYTFHEVEENESELIRLKRWYRKILKRDFFRSQYSLQCAKRLEECDTCLRMFINRVYETEGFKEGELI